jgi:hypothetical protein
MDERIRVPGDSVGLLDFVRRLLGEKCGSAPEREANNT